jgi:hypothetical protein
VQIEYAEDEYSAGVKAAELPIFNSYAYYISLLFDTEKNITTSTLLQFSLTAEVVFPVTESIEETVPSRPIPHLTMSQYFSYSGTMPLVSQVLVAGSLDLIDPTFLDGTRFANSDYMLTLLDTLTGKE